MARMSLFALGIAELRDMFRATPGLSDRLRAIAAEHFPPPELGRRPRRLIGRIGPALKRPIDEHQAPARPAPADVEALLAGRAIPLERRSYAWQIVLAWLDASSWGQIGFDLDAHQLANLEFALGRAGLPSHFDLESLLLDNPQLPLRPLEGMRFGYAKNQHVEATRHALSNVVGDLDEDALAVVGPLLEFLNGYPGWAEQAAADARPVPDLIAIWMP